MTPARVRFAPSPTGPLHIGGVRTALYNYALAKRSGGAFVLRIEDTDQNRYVEGAEAYIREALAWCGLHPDEGPREGGPYAPYRQSERTARYRAAVDRLLASGHAYYAFDTPEALDAERASAEAQGRTFRYDATTRDGLDNALGLDRGTLASRLATDEPRVVRLRVGPGEEIAFADEIRGTVRVSSDQLDDKVLLKADGLPTYHLANVVDDEHMAITHVVRGEEWLPSTAHHVLLYRAFGWEARMPTFAHLPLILKPEGSGKLSKRDGAKFGVPVFPLEWDDAASGETYAGFRESGFLPEAVVNFLALLGWNPGTDQEIFSLAAFAEAFDLDHVSKSGARFDYDKAKWFNQQYVMALDEEAFAAAARRVLAKADLPSDAPVGEGYLRALHPLLRERLVTLDDLPTEHRYAFAAPEAYDDQQVRKRAGKVDARLYEVVAAALERVGDWRAGEIGTAVKAAVAEAGGKPGAVFPLYRIALTGGMSGPDVFALSEVLGRDETLKRWRRGAAAFRNAVA